MIVTYVFLVFSATVFSRPYKAVHSYRLLPLLKQKLRLRHIVLAALTMSYTIELSQLIFCKGLFELFDDPFHNVVGAVVGYEMYMVVKKSKYFSK